MFQPFRLALTCALLWRAAAVAEPMPEARTRRERTVTVAGSTDEPLPIVRVARDTPTLLLFSSPIQKRMLTFDEARIRVVDAGERSIIVQPVTDLAEGERQQVGVFFADGTAPARATFVLVNDSAEVDTRIDVQRSEPPVAPCPAGAQDVAPKPEDFLLRGYMGEGGVTAAATPEKDDGAQGLRAYRGVSYRGKGWILVDVPLQNRAQRPVWTPREAAFTGRAGMPLRARLALVGTGAIPPSGTERVIAVAELPENDANQVLTLEVRGTDGRRIVIPDVRFQRPIAGGTP
ncbi:DUF2381 family protein [Myxococcus sp. SDU36]|uniref:DUF2381 family protein n=1 Tax=Myxococcus sp. SDU36 TaxID=2831967 RepID=UPI002543A330|nr:DUF2381 family protein [Myxococcus sp. SDU36]WIG94640.1 DUF2381 family protein [Myxococcus sp. SDU36]